MPFTISHAAVVLPFSRVLARWRALSAAVIGSMVPDFGFFVPGRMPRVETHSAWGLLTFCMPVGLTTYWVFQYVIKTPVLELLPDGAYARWRECSSPADVRSVRQWLVAALGVLAGAVTHLVWDGFSHEGARGVRMLPMLDEPIIEYGGHSLRAVRLMQDGSSLVGLVVVIVFLVYALRRGHDPIAATRRLSSAERRRWICGYMLTAIAAAAACYVWARFNARISHYVMVIASYAAIAALRGLAASLLAVSILLRIYLRTRAHARTQVP